MRRYIGILVALFLLAATAGYAQDLPPVGRLMITQTSRWGDGLSGVVKNFGPGKMCAVVVSARTFEEGLGVRGADQGARTVTYSVGDLDRDQEGKFNLSSVFVKGIAPGGPWAEGVPCR